MQWDDITTTEWSIGVIVFSLTLLASASMSKINMPVFCDEVGGNLLTMPIDGMIGFVGATLLGWVGIQVGRRADLIIQSCYDWCQILVWDHYPLHVKWKVGLSNWFTLSVCLQTSVYDRGTTSFQLNVMFWTFIGKQICNLAVFRLWICPECACAERSEIIFFWLSGNQ